MYSLLKAWLWRKPKGELSDEEFFLELLSTTDWWNIKHYGNCLRFAKTGYYLVVGSSLEDRIHATLHQVKEGIVLQHEVCSVKDEADSIKELCFFLEKVYRYLKSEDPSACKKWVDQLRSSENVAKLIDKKVRVT